jgi:phosphatidate cytidylyltransferase
VSPTKNEWGALGGAVAVGVATVAALGAGLIDLAPQPAAVLVLLISTLGQAGDLFESLLKRAAGVRHSGSLFGSQGGVLDAVDGLLFVAPAAWSHLQLLAPRSLP